MQLSSFLFIATLLTIVVLFIRFRLNTLHSPVTIPTTQDIKPTVVSNPTSSAANDATANWKTYRNENWGFELQYSKIWSISEEEKASGFILSANSQFESPLVDGPISPITVKYSFDIKAVENHNNKTIDDIVNSIEYNPIKPRYIKQKIGIYNVYKLTNSPSMYGRLDMIMEKPDKTNYIVFEFYPFNSQQPYTNQETAEKEFSHILSTFKFTTSSE